MNKYDKYHPYIQACLHKADECMRLCEQAFMRGDKAMAKHWFKTAMQHEAAAKKMDDLTRLHA